MHEEKVAIEAGILTPLKAKHVTKQLLCGDMRFVSRWRKVTVGATARREVHHLTTELSRPSYVLGVVPFIGRHKVNGSSEFGTQLSQFSQVAV